MNKSKAKKAADEFTGTIGDLLKIIGDSGKDGMSIVNKSFPKQMILDILRDGIKHRDPDEKPLMFTMDVYSRAGAMRGTPDRLTVQNIFRECA